MSIKSVLAAVGLLALPAGANASTFTDQVFYGAGSAAAFLGALGSVSIQQEDFSGYADGTAIGGTGDGLTFGTGVTVEAELPSSDNFVQGEALRLSLDNPNRNPTETPFTRTITFKLPNLTNFFGIDFGRLDDGGNLEFGIGNDNGSLVVQPISFDLNTLTPGGDDIQYVGFFGFTSAKAFDRIVLQGSSNNNFNFDDDFVADNAIFASGELAPVPVPAALPLLAAGLGVFGLMGRRARRRG